MQPVTLLLLSRPSALAIRNNLRSQVIDGTHVATVVLKNDTPVIWCDPWSIEAELFVEIILHCRNVRTLHLVQCPFDSIYPEGVQQLADRGVFSQLHELRIGDPGLYEETLFLLLSAMPRLKVLHIGEVYHNPDADSDSWPRPACSLTTLSVTKDSDEFEHYGLLLANSHDTLTELCLEQIWDTSVLSNICRALSSCTRVRNLRRIGAMGLEDVIASCPRVRSLTLSVPLSRAQVNAMRARPGIQELRVTPSADSDQSFVVADMLEWRDSINELPSLRALAFPMPLEDSSRMYAAYYQLISLCSERRILHSAT